MADNEGQYGIIRSFFRFLRFWNWRKARAINRAADAQFTSTPEGIEDAFDIHGDNIVDRIKSIRKAIGTSEQALETKRTRITDLNGLIEKKGKSLSGALSTVLKFENATDEEGKAKATQAKADAAEYKKQIDEWKGEITRIDGDIKAYAPRMAKLTKLLQDLRKEYENLELEKQAAIAEHISNEMLIETFDQLDGLTKSLDRSPLDAVRKHNKERSAEARVAGRLHDAETNDREKDYAEAGAAESADSDIDQMLANMRKAKAESTGEAAPADRDRPKI